MTNEKCEFKFRIEIKEDGLTCDILEATTWKKLRKLVKGVLKERIKREKEIINDQ